MAYTLLEILTSRSVYFFNWENNEQEANHQEKTVGSQEKEETDSQKKSFCEEESFFKKEV